ncbi:MAG: M20/M25/M40 family metallo-hydrolase [Oscillospiraceae bacterium]
MDRIKKNLKALCLATGVSGLENEASIVASEMLLNYTKDVSIDHFGNVVGIIKSSNKNAKTILLDAHIDEIGMVVTAIDDKGFVKFANCGGIDRRLLSAQLVTIHGKKDIVGVVGSKPPHLESKEDADKIAEITDMFIDIGYDKETALQNISLGDKITIPSDFVEMLNDRVSCKAMDDRSGVCAILEALELLKGKELPVNVAIQFSSREEVGGQGAKIASYTASPDMAIAIDVSFAFTPDAVEHRCGKMGEGVMIGYHAILDKTFSDKLLAVAKEKEIKYIVEPMGGSSTGTNADGIILTKGGVKTALLSIPLKYMHTPIEQVALSDMKETAKLVAEFIQIAGEL